MYWYLSFLRPPPVSASITGGSITITPQVANDLRTELRYDPTEVYYTWQRIYPIPSPVEQLRHLTTFSPPASTYRPISIPLPEQAKPGDEWRLGLFSTSDTNCILNGILELSGGDADVLGVWSEGIRMLRGEVSAPGTVKGISSDKRKKPEEKDRPNGKKDMGKGKEREKVEDAPKQGRILREWGMPGGDAFQIVEQTSFDLDKKIWDSGLALASWLLRHLPEVQPTPTGTQTIFDILRRRRRREAHAGYTRIVELGSGTGLVSIALALGLRLGDSNAAEVDITVTDLPSAIELMEQNLKLNGFRGDNEALEAVHVQAKVLDWDEPLPSWISSEGPWPELIIAADVTYNTASFPFLLQTLTALLCPTSGESPLLLLAYKQRDASERELWALLGGAGVRMEKVDHVRGAEAEGEEGVVEIWVGQRAREAVTGL